MGKRGRPRSPGILTAREQEVLALIREGRSNEEIARRLGISIGGAKFHVSEILSKLGVGGRHEAARWRPEEPQGWSGVVTAGPLLLLRRMHVALMPSAVAAGATLVVVGVAALAYGVMATRGDRAEAKAQASAQRVLLNEGDLPVFTSFGSDCSRSFGDKGIHTGETPLERALITNCMNDAIVNTAVYGDGRAQIDAFARSIGYEPPSGLRPFTTIHGTFVATHRGIFEIYDSVKVFTNEAMAHERFQQEIYPRAGMLTSYDEHFIALGHEAKMWTGVFGPDPDAYVTQYVTEWRRGRVVAWVNTMGAPDLTAEDNARLVAIMDARIQQEFRQ